MNSAGPCKGGRGDQQKLTTLGRVITALVEHLGHVPYRYIWVSFSVACK
jgi:hypothetical protein